ncbi:MAG: STAS/SEC14 domain-containing protein [Bacteroidetes bacterium]|nr:STAS/SEC14 domain-containing protein [Bacteroidota bacterium]
MKIPDNTEVYDWKSSTFWFDNEGIVCSISKKVPPQNLEDTKKVIEDFKKIIGERKVCMLIDVTNSSESTREVRNLAAEEFPKFVKAIAMVSQSALGKMLANLFFTIKSQPYPTKMFNDEAEAKEWLKKHL